MEPEKLKNQEILAPLEPVYNEKKLVRYVINTYNQEHNDDQEIQCIGSGSGGAGSYVATAASQQFSSNPIQVIEPEVQIESQNMPAQQIENVVNIENELQVTTPQPYPLKECYTDDSNYMCCNNELEDIIKETYSELSANARSARQVAPVIVRDNRPDGSPPVQAIADRLQANIEGRMNTTFEIIVGRGDFASKSRFFGNFICKVRQEKRFILAYGTPKKSLSQLFLDLYKKTVSSAPSTEFGYGSNAYQRLKTFYCLRVFRITSLLM
uniref:Ground-like domain-containing protein n=1 Tax=Ditylenchus dipsaci TaxID=166011 RepID=A0A915DLV3_9BILA